jgi:hypothetical protein
VNILKIRNIISFIFKKVNLTFTFDPLVIFVLWWGSIRALCCEGRVNCLVMEA